MQQDAGYQSCLILSPHTIPIPKEWEIFGDPLARATWIYQVKFSNIYRFLNNYDESISSILLFPKSKEWFSFTYLRPALDIEYHSFSSV